MTGRVPRWLTALLIVILLVSTEANVALPRSRAEDAAAASASLEQRVLEEAARALGWPTAVEQRMLARMGSDAEVVLMLWPPQSAVRYFTRPVYSATNGGSYEEETVQYMRILSLGEAGCREFVDKLVENGFTHSSYQGREGVVLRHGDKICNPGGLIGYIMDLIRKWVKEILPESEADPCAEADAGMIVWTCGAYAFVARDDTGSGAEDAIAAALYLASQRQNLCNLGDTLVILAGAGDKQGTTPLATYHKIAQDLNSYYGQNAYGRVSLAYTFMDADGANGTADWYSVGPAIAPYANRNTDFAIAAVKKAFEGGAPCDEVNLARVIVVYAGASKQIDPANGSFQTACSWPPNAQWFDIEVGQAPNTSHVYAGSLVMVAENDGLGLWAHEVGHSLFSHIPLYGNYYYVSDRYNYTQPWGQFGNVGNWDLMGAGNWWGDPLASSPVQMSGFTKESAEWLSYLDARLGQEYTLTALERQKAGGTVLRVDDPRSIDPRQFFILEARDSTAAFGAPESGVVLYEVTWSGADNHYVVNTVSPAGGATVGSGPGGIQYGRPTLRGVGTANAPVTRRWPAARLEWTLVSESKAGGYSAVVTTNVYTPTNLVGAVVAPAGGAAVPRPAGAPEVASGPYLPLPDVDLHAYDDKGRHVGIDYQTGQYEALIPGAEFSGDLKDAPEWIYVPEGTAVRFVVSNYRTVQFLKANPQYAATVRPQGYQTTYQMIDSEGVITEARGERGSIEAGKDADLGGAFAPGLSYKPVRAVGYGRNLPENLYLAGLLAAIAVMGLVGWIVALARR